MLSRQGKILAFVNLFYGVVHALVLIWVFVFTLFISSRGNKIAWENDLVHEPLLGISIVFPVVTLPFLIAGYALLRLKTWAKMAATISASLAFIIAAFFAFMTIAEEDDLITAYYFIPGIGMSLYSFWLLYLGRKAIYK